MTNKLLASIFFIFTIALFSCKNESGATTSLKKSFTDSAARMHLNYPENWDYDSSLAKLQEDITNPKDVFQENITLGAEIVPPGFPLDDFAKSFCLKYKLLDSNYKQLSYEDSKINDIKTKKVIFTTTYGDLHYKSMVQIALKDSFGYFLQANALDTSFASHEKTFDAIMNTFHAF